VFGPTCAIGVVDVKWLLRSFKRPNMGKPERSGEEFKGGEKTDRSRLSCVPATNNA
jgi:hypothetical protein